LFVFPLAAQSLVSQSSLWHDAIIALQDFDLSNQQAMGGGGTKLLRTNEQSPHNRFFNRIDDLSSDLPAVASKLRLRSATKHDLLSNTVSNTVSYAFAHTVSYAFSHSSSNTAAQSSANTSTGHAKAGTNTSTNTSTNANARDTTATNVGCAIDCRGWQNKLDQFERACPN
jgi:hypothetical protein